MSRHLLLNVQDYSSGQDVNNVTKCSNLCCACCLEKNTQFINLGKCSHAGFMEYCTKIKMENLNGQVICVQCHAMLMKIEQFRKQVEDSFHLLQASLQTIDTNVKRTKLIIQKTEPIDIFFSIKDEDFTSPLKQIESITEENFELDVKIEHVSNSDVSDDDYNVPLIELKAEAETIAPQPETIALQPETIAPQPENIAPQPENIAPQPENIAPQPENIASQPETIAPQPENKHEITEKALHKIKKNIRKKYTTKSEVKHNNDNDHLCKKSKFEGKIRQFDLTEQELLAERQQLSQSEKYLNLPFRCESCIVGFVYEPSLKEHFIKKHPEVKAGGRVCAVCRLVLNRQSSYRQHMQRHYRRYECLVCEKRVNDLNTMVQHYNGAHGVVDHSRYRCVQCDFTTGSYNAFRHHKEKHRGARQCSLCDQTFVNNAKLKTHLNSMHGTGRVFECVPCGKSYRYRSGFVLHRASHHATPGGEERAYCVPCNKLYRTEHNLRKHLRLHARHRADNIDKFECDTCGVKFITKKELVSHISFKHLRDTPYKCASCDNRSFRTASTLRAHVKRVHNRTPQPRNQICHHCGKGFVTTAILRTHIRTHTGERPLVCAHCPATFAHPAARYTHTKLLHKKNLPN